ncbi:DegT/DnrJ/EryC1/StrS family aminotransferase [Microbacterium sp. zg.B48]|uniref:DegT/DnrJ/EryC1/StrS family aminotransferase n=1 Tax=unclassified Microbacterium TaxID=2609290 RepID=UPI00214B467B|nr:MULTISPECIES: DegT/DnrJ/EryC1/StrS family aminotransferase [unclassified Microbacterium]MCR2765137.1 DegT/DnrJ/EryC1/StrS family aminotransferase [Microbacterium sp. zg.B48]MCR2810262.1 DegT/DnrJ/EryC1/StrS family aminotransferase [Microbacterium sp. zg.B185]WIM19909.1 DegT/DnrJ/EryC1/StrS family aminotransferase [Microbacterium sp. zg-B185]
MRLNIPLTGAAEVDAVRAVLESGYLTQGARTAEFELAVKEYVGTRHAAAVSSATTGLHLTLVALGVSAGDEVIIPGFSFPATANAVIQQSAVPIFVDIVEDTFNLDPALVEAAITPRTRAIMPVHAFGLCAEMSPINDIAARYGLPVIEDAACALGGTYHGRQAGSLATAGVFSFHPRKIITTAEGGMIMTDDDELAARIAVLRAHGATRGELYMEFIDAGFNYRLSDVHSAIGLAQMQRIDEIVSGRRRAAAALTDRLSNLEGVRTPCSAAGTEHTFQSYVVMLDDSIDRDAVIRSMRARDVETTLGTYGMHLQPYFRDRFDIRDEALPHTTRAHHQALTLPLYPQLTPDDLDLIALALGESVAESERVV